jgi:hypothetical protein
MAGRRRISQGGATLKILRGVYPESIEGLRTTFSALQGGVGQPLYPPLRTDPRTHKTQGQTGFEEKSFEPQNIEQGISNFEESTLSFCGFLFNFRHSVFLERRLALYYYKSAEIARFFACSRFCPSRKHPFLPSENVDAGGDQDKVPPQF